MKKGEKKGCKVAKEQRAKPILSCSPSYKYPSIDGFFCPLSLYLHFIFIFFFFLFFCFLCLFLLIKSPI